MDYTVIKNVKREKGGITHPDSVYNESTNLTQVCWMKASEYNFDNGIYTVSLYFQFAKDNSLLFYETSAKESANLEKVLNIFMVIL